LCRDRSRLYQVVLDGTTIGVLANGEAKSFPVAFGCHSLWLGVEAGGSIATAFSARPGVTSAFVCRPDSVPWSVWRRLWGRQRSVVLEPDPTAYRPVEEPEMFPQRLAS
jgi:hypothetical protein